MKSSSKQGFELVKKDLTPAAHLRKKDDGGLALIEASKQKKLDTIESNFGGPATTSVSPLPEKIANFASI